MSYVKNDIHPTAKVGERVRMGLGNYVGPYCIINDGVKMGDGNYFESHTVIGAPPEHKLAWTNFTNKGVVIGNNNRFSSFVTVDGGYFRDTVIHDDCYFLRGSHVGHCVIVESGSGIHCNSILGGVSHIMRGAYLGLGSILNPKGVIGAYSLIGSNSLVLEKSVIAPFTKHAGSPCEYLGPNTQKLTTFLNMGQNEEDMANLCIKFEELRSKK